MVAAKAGLERAGSDSFAQRQGKLLGEGFSFSGFERDGLYLNTGKKTFENISGVSGIDSLSDGRGAVFADFDNDGDIDVFLTTIQGQAHLLFRNNVGQDHGFIRVSLEGRESGRDAFGAVVRVKTSRGIQSKIKSGGGGFNSQADPRLVFGMGRDRRAEWVEVRWPSGTKQKFERVLAGASLKIIEGEAELRRVKERRFSLPEPISRSEARVRTLKVRVGDTFPDLALASLKGGERTGLHRLLEPGSTYLVNLWATWCIPCAREMPELQKIHEKNSSRLQIIGISLDPRQDEPRVAKFLKKHRVGYGNYLGPGDLVGQIYATDEVFIPLSFLLDGRGRVLEVFTGWSGKARERLNALFP